VSECSGVESLTTFPTLAPPQTAEQLSTGWGGNIGTSQVVDLGVVVPTAHSAAIRPERRF
jgi:hypothetical protein